MLSVQEIKELSEQCQVPFEDALLIALNTNGVDFECGYDRMRTALRLSNGSLFSYAIKKGDLDYYLAMPVHHNSPFKIRNGYLFLVSDEIGEVHGTKEDQCNSHYVRRNVTSININTNLRTNCRGCDFCYTAYQVSNGEYKLSSVSDFDNFFEGIMLRYSLGSLKSIQQLSVVTGCYIRADELIKTLLNLKESATKYDFGGKIFYLGSQLVGTKDLMSIQDIKPFGLCFSVEVFEKRNILRGNKRSIGLAKAQETLLIANDLGYESTISYVLGLEPLDIVEKYFCEFKDFINKFPTINTLQVHRQQLAKGLGVYGPNRLKYFLQARLAIESIFLDTDMRPLVWENYRGLWFLRFAEEELSGCRYPRPITSF